MFANMYLKYLLSGCCVPGIMLWIRQINVSSTMLISKEEKLIFLFLPNLELDIEKSESALGVWLWRNSFFFFYGVILYCESQITIKLSTKDNAASTRHTSSSHPGACPCIRYSLKELIELVILRERG